MIQGIVGQAKNHGAKGVGAYPGGGVLGRFAEQTDRRLAFALRRGGVELHAQRGECAKLDVV